MVDAGDQFQLENWCARNLLLDRPHAFESHSLVLLRREQQWPVTINKAEGWITGGIGWKPAAYNAR